MRKIIGNTVFLLLLLTLSAATAFLTYLHFFAPEDENLSGEWTAEVDFTGQAAGAALGWLQEIEAVSVSFEEVEACMGELTVQVELSFEQTAPSEGSFHCKVLPESYDVCSQAAYEAFAEAFHALLTERLRMAGYADGTDKEAVEELVAETFGMSTVSYLMTCGPALLPSLEELQAQYDGSGVYRTAEGVLVREFDADGSAVPRQERYIREGSCLILTGETDFSGSVFSSERYPVMYLLKETQNP